MRQQAIDERPGPAPTIRADAHSIVFEFDETSGQHGMRLVIRCDDEGEVLASIVRVENDRDL